MRTGQFRVIELIDALVGEHPGKSLGLRVVKPARRPELSWDPNNTSKNSSCLATNSLDFAAMASLLSACLRKGATCRRANFLRSMAVAQAGSYRLLSDAAVVEDIAPSSQKRQRKTKEIDPNAPVVEKRKAGRPKKITVDKKIKVKDASPPNARKPGRLTYATRLKNAPIFPPGWDLPPLDEWRSYFPVSKDTLAKAVVRKPESAALMAEAFVPEGSRDKIIIDASPGALSLLSPVYFTHLINIII